MTWQILSILCAMIVLGGLAKGHGDLNDQWSRVSWSGMGIGCLLAVCAPNPWSGLLLAQISLGMLWNAPMSVLYREKVAQGLVWAGGYVLLAPLMTREMMPWLLTALSVVGTYTGLWAIYSSLQEKDVGYQHILWGGWLRLVDRDGGAPLAGQGNFNHAQSVGTLSTASALALLWLHHWWAAPFLLLSLATVTLSTEGRMTGNWVCQGWVHLGWVGFAVIGISVGTFWAWWLWGSILLIGLLWARPWKSRKGWYDSGRFASWNQALREIWWTANQPKDPVQALELTKNHRLRLEEIQRGAAEREEALLHNQMTIALQQNAQEMAKWEALGKAKKNMTPAERDLYWRLWAQRVRTRLIGCGTGTWYPLTKWPSILKTGTLNKATQAWEGMVYLSAHNEYVELWFEQGLLGLVAALGLTWYALTTVMSGMPALMPLVIGLISICCLNFPFSLFQEVAREPGSPPLPPGTQPQYVGSPALLVMSWTILLLIEAVR